MTRYEKIKEYLDSLDTADLVQIHNEYCEGNNAMDDYIYSMEEFDEICSGMTAWEVARSAFYGKFCPAHDYFYFNGYGNLASFDYHFSTHTDGADYDDPIYTADIADYIDCNEDSLNNDEIQDILDEDEETEEEED